MALMDSTLADAIKPFGRYVTTGDVSRSCGNNPCAFDLPRLGVSGLNPARRDVQMAQQRASGSVSSRFYGVTGENEPTLNCLKQTGGPKAAIPPKGATRCEQMPSFGTEGFEFMLKWQVPTPTVALTVAPTVATFGMNK